MQIDGALIRRPSCDWNAKKTRPLHVKVSILLRMLMVKLDFDGDGDVDWKDLGRLQEMVGVN